MSRLFLPLLTLVLFLSWSCAANAGDGAPNRYRVAIDEEAMHAEVDADLWLDGDILALFNVFEVPGLEHGQASLLEDLRVTDAAGVPLAVQDLGGGDFRLPQGGRIHARYRVRLAHDQ